MYTMRKKVRKNLIRLLNLLDKYIAKGHKNKVFEIAEQIQDVADYEELDWAEVIVTIERNPKTDRMNPMWTNQDSLDHCSRGILQMVKVCIKNNCWPEEQKFKTGEPDILEQIIKQMEMEGEITQRRYYSLLKLHKGVTSGKFKRGDKGEKGTTKRYTGKKKKEGKF